MSADKMMQTVLVMVLVMVVLFFAVDQVREGAFDGYLGIDRKQQKWTVNGTQGINERFEISYVQSRPGEKIKIIRDRETGTSYLFVQDGGGAGMVPMNMKVELVNDLLKAAVKGR